MQTPLGPSMPLLSQLSPPPTIQDALHFGSCQCLNHKFLSFVSFMLTCWRIKVFLKCCVEYPSREGNGTPLQYSCLENPMDGGAWWAAVHGVTMSVTRLSDFTFTFHFHALEKEMATHSSVLAWRILEAAEPGGLPSMGLHRVGHDWSNLAAAAAAAAEYPSIWICFIVSFGLDSV